MLKLYRPSHLFSTSILHGLKQECIQIVMYNFTIILIINQLHNCTAKIMACWVRSYATSAPSKLVNTAHTNTNCSSMSNNVLSISPARILKHWIRCISTWILIPAIDFVVIKSSGVICISPFVKGGMFSLDFVLEKQILNVKTFISHHWVTTLQTLQQTTLLCYSLIRNRTFKHTRYKCHMAMWCYIH